MTIRTLPHAGRYGIVLADPAWQFETRGRRGHGKSAELHYPTMPLDEIKALPVADIVGPDAVLCLWFTAPLMYAPGFPPAAVAAAWGFDRYSSVGVWTKRPRNWRGDPTKFQTSTGYTFRGATEFLGVWRRGNPSWDGRRERGLWDAPIREHSQKPDDVRAAIERAGAGIAAPRVELFAQESAPGWDRWGFWPDRFD